MSYRTAFFVTAACLAGAVGYIATRPAAPTAEGAPTASAEPLAVAPTATSTITAKDIEIGRLRAKLDKCQDQSWELAADLMKGGAALPAPASAPPVDEAASALCPISQAYMRYQWEQQKPLVSTIFSKELGTEAWVERDTTLRIARHRDMFDLAARDEAELERGYRGLWHRHGAALRGRAADGDWEGAAEVMRSIWRDEDAMLGEVLRPEEVASYTKSEGQLRTTLLALFATYAEQPWDAQSLAH